MAETRVNLRHLLEDLRDAYPIPAEEVIVSELVANALDSGAHRLRFLVAPAGRSLTLVDDGRGMSPHDLVRFHDIAATTKVRGKGIGFAGVGVKLSLLIAEAVITETKRGRHHASTRWLLENPQRAPWKKVKPDGLVAGNGTAVTIMVRDPGSALLRPEFIMTTVQRHFRPLVDPILTGRVLDALYRGRIEFTVNGLPLAVAPADPDRKEFQVRLGTRGKLAGVGWIRIGAGPLPEDERGLGISTYGKVIKRGWDWLGISPKRPDQVAGLVEAPLLASALTINKADFLRDGPSLWKVSRFRRALVRALEPLLAELGEKDATVKPERPVREAVRDLHRALEGLAAEFPSLAALVGTGGKGPLPGSGPGAGTEGESSPGEAIAGQEPPPDEPAEDGPQVPDAAPPAVAEEAATDGESGTRPRAGGFVVEIEDRPDREEPAWIAGRSLRVNRAHPAFRRSAREGSESYHLAMSAAWAIAQLLDRPDDRQRFINRFMRNWGGVPE